MKNNLIMPFIDQSENYTLGFEAGQIWSRCEQELTFENYLIHSLNEKQVELIMQHFGYEFNIVLVDGEWSYLTAKHVNINNLFI